MRLIKILPERGDNPFEFNDLLQMIQSNTFPPIYREEFYMNDDGNIVWDTYFYGNKLPAATSIFEVVK